MSILSKLVKKTENTVNKAAASTKKYVTGETGGKLNPIFKPINRITGTKEQKQSQLRRLAGAATGAATGFLKGGLPGLAIGASLGYQSDDPFTARRALMEGGKGYLSGAVAGNAISNWAGGMMEGTGSGVGITPALVGNTAENTGLADLLTRNAGLGLMGAGLINGNKSANADLPTIGGRAGTANNVNNDELIAALKNRYAQDYNKLQMQRQLQTKQLISGRGGI